MYWVFCLHVCVPCLVRSEEVIRSSRTRIPDGCESRGCWESNPGSLGEQPVLLPAGPSLKPLSLKVFGESTVYGGVSSRKDKDSTLTLVLRGSLNTHIGKWGCRENTYTHPSLASFSNEIHNEGGWTLPKMASVGDPEPDCSLVKVVSISLLSPSL